MIANTDGTISEGNDARKIIYPGAGGDPWWDTNQLLEQMHMKAIPIFDHASLGPDALNAFDMNQSDGGKQRIRQDTVIPDDESVPNISQRGKRQAMKTPGGEAKGLESVLTEHGFNTKGIKAKCKPVCPFENTDCCLACILSWQSDFVNQKSMIETLVEKAGHLCMFLPKFHCKLNPIEMVCFSHIS